MSAGAVFGLALMVVLLPGCPSGVGNQDPVLPASQYATLWITNAAMATADQRDAIVEIRVRGPYVIGFGLNMLPEETRILVGETMPIYLDTQGSNSDWDVLLTYTHYDEAGAGRRYRVAISIPNVRDDRVYTWNWGGHQEYLDALEELEGEAPDGPVIGFFIQL